MCPRALSLFFLVLSRKTTSVEAQFISRTSWLLPRSSTYGNNIEVARETRPPPNESFAPESVPGAPAVDCTRWRESMAIYPTALLFRAFRIIYKSIIYITDFFPLLNSHFAILKCHQLFRSKAQLQLYRKI